MSRKQQSPYRLRRRLSYTPIMLTSKSMKPINRNMYEYNRKQSPVKNQSLQQSIDFVLATSFLNKNTNPFINTNTNQIKEEIINQVTQSLEEQYNYQIISNHQKQITKQHNLNNNFSNNHPFKQKDKKKNQKLMQSQNGAAIVQVQFKNKNDRKIHSNIKQNLRNKLESEKYQNYRSDFRKYVYCTNYKTYSELGKIQKIITMSNKIQNKKIKGLDTSDKIQKQQEKYNQTEQWNKFLFFHYLNIRKVSPKTKKSLAANIQHIPIQKMEEISSKVQAILRRHQKRSSTTSANIRISKLKNQPIFQKFQNNEIQIKKIQQDIIYLSKRTLSSKKQFFVFGLSQTNKPNNWENNLKTRIDYYRDFLFKINFSNGLYVKNREDIDKPYKFYVGKGNNSMLIKGIIKRRFWWQFVQKEKDNETNSQECINFIWAQLKLNDYLSVLKNGSDHKKSIRSIIKIKPKNIKYTNGGNINTQQLEKCKFKKIQQSVNNQKNKVICNEITKPTPFYNQANDKIMKGIDLELWKSHFNRYQQIQEKFTDGVYLKRFNTMLQKKQICLIEDPNQTQVHNHFQCNYYLGNKKALFYYLTRYYKAKGIDQFTKIPLTFHISKGVDDPQYEKFLQTYSQLEQKKKDKNQNQKNIWIMKPGEYTNRGKGITVCSYLDQIKTRLKGKQKNPVNNKPRTFILQKYIQKPLLYHKRKFDIRHYMLMTCFNGTFKGYWYGEGYLRTTSTQYNVKNTKDIYTHLTNDAVQQKNPNYGKYQKGNKVSYADFQKYMNKIKGFKQKSSESNQTYIFAQQTLPIMKQLATDAIRATYNVLSPNRKNQTFELFGLDFMIDQQLSVYLIEVNTNPCLQTSCPLLMKIISGLIENVFKICIDPFFPPPLQWPTTKKFQMGDNSLEQNNFQLIFDQKFDGPQIQRLLIGSQIGNIGEIGQDDDTYEDDGPQWNQDNEQNKS